MLRYLTAAALMLALPAPMAAQDIPDLAERMEAARDAEEIGRLMAEVQQAAAIAQRQYAGMVQNAVTTQYMGAIALPGEDLGVWDTVIVGRVGESEDAPLVALAEYEITQGEILSETIHLSGEAPLLDGQASAMAQARMFAPRAIIAAGHTAFCADEGADGQATPSVTFATIVLPPREDGSFNAYVLNGPIEEGAIPLGRHFRVTFDAFGLTGEPELITDTCEVVTWDPEADGAANAYVTEYPGGSVPSEIHAYLSSLLPMSLGVVTGDIVWPVAGGNIAPPAPTSAAGDASTE